jgi:hypothetical protein
MEFKKEDVVTVAEAVIEEQLRHDNSDTSAYGYWCNFCNAGDKNGESLSYEEPDKIVHKLHCPVLVAKDLLTGVC